MRKPLARRSCKARAAGDRVVEWRNHHPDREDQLTIHELYSDKLVEYIKRRARAFASAKALKGTPEFDRIRRKRLGELIRKLPKGRDIAAFRQAANR